MVARKFLQCLQAWALLFQSLLKLIGLCGTPQIGELLEYDMTIIASQELYTECDSSLTLLLHEITCQQKTVFD